MVLTVLLISGAVSGMAEALFDTISIPALLAQARKPRSFLGFKYRILQSEKWDPRYSWTLKYGKPLKKQKSAPWYYFGLYVPVYKEAFAFASTLLVAFTDPWHYLKFLMQPLHVTAIVWALYYAHEVKEVPEWHLVLHFCASVFWPMAIFHLTLRYLRRGHDLDFGL